MGFRPGCSLCINIFLRFSIPRKIISSFECGIKTTTMRYSIFYLMLLTMVAGNIRAQAPARLFKVHFSSDESSLDRQDLVILQQIVTAYKAAPYAEITLYAHTDNNAGEAYNQALSKRRALSVKAYLVKQGVNPGHITWSFFGENQPLTDNRDDQARAENRRVEIRLETHRFENVGHLLKTAGGNYRQSFTIDPTRPNTIHGRNGTLIVIPAVSLVDANGQTLTSPVTVSLSEFLKPGDALFQSFSTQTTEGELLETGGMLKLDASAGDRPVMIREGSQVQVRIPATGILPGMEVFNGRTNPAGIMEWVATGKPFGPPLPGAMNAEANDLKEMSFYFSVAPPPKRPYKPTVPHVATYASQWKHLTLWEHLTLGSAAKREKMMLYRQRIDLINKRSTDEYIRKMNDYQVKYANYQNDSVMYVKRYTESFDNWVDKQIRLQQVFIQALKPGFSDSAALKNLVASGAGSILSRSEVTYFKKLTHLHTYRYLADKHVDILYVLQRMKTQGIIQAYSWYGHGNFICCIDNYKGRKSGQHPVPLTPGVALVTVARALAVDETARPVIVPPDASTYQLTEQQVTYSAYISTFGVINCDRFSKTPPGMFVHLTVPLQGQAQVAFYLPSQKSFLYATPGENGYVARIPRNTAYTVFIMSLKGQQPLFYTEKGKSGEPAVITADLQPVTLARLREEFLGL